MDDNGQLTINDLEETLQKQAVNQFADFYLQHYDRNDLEILAQYPVDHYIADINDHLKFNRYLTHQQRLADSVSFSYQDYVELLDTLKLKFFANGHPAENWKQWYTEQYDQIYNASKA